MSGGRLTSNSTLNNLNNRNHQNNPASYSYSRGSTTTPSVGLGLLKTATATARESVESVGAATTEGGVLELVGSAELIVDAFGTLTKM